MSKVRMTKKLSSWSSKAKSGLSAGSCGKCHGGNSGGAGGACLKLWQEEVVEDAINSLGEAWPRRRTKIELGDQG